MNKRREAKLRRQKDRKEAKEARQLPKWKLRELQHMARMFGLNSPQEHTNKFYLATFPPERRKEIIDTINRQNIQDSQPGIAMIKLANGSLFVASEVPFPGSQEVTARE